MTDEPTKKTDQARLQEPRPQGGSTSSGSKSPSPFSSLIQGDPIRRGFGDKVDDPSKRAEPSKPGDEKSDLPRPGGQTDEDGGEHDRGPRADAMKVASDNRSLGESSPLPSRQTWLNQPTLPKQQTQQGPETSVHGKSGSDCSTPVEGSTKPARTQSGGSATV